MLLEAVMLAIDVVLVATIASWVTGAVAAPEDSITLRALVWGIVATAAVVISLTLLGWVGLISIWWLVALHAVLAAVTFAATRPLDRTASPDPAATPLSRATIAVALACIAVGAMAVAMGLSGRATGTDTVHYHMANAVEWLNS